MSYLTLSLNRLLQPQIQDRIAWMLALGLVVLLGHALANLTWSALAPSQPAPPPPAPAAHSAARPTSGPDYGQIAQLSLFGQAQAEPNTPRAAPLDAPDTRLNLTLRGILFNRQADQARAIIAAPGKDDEQYRVGQEISRGVRIDSIFSDRVILLREGQYETLRLPEDRVELQDGTQAQPRTVQRAATRGGQRLSSTQRSPTQRSGTTTVDGQTARELTQLRQQLLERPDQAVRYLNAQPVNRNGGLAGFRVNPGADDRLFNMSGLQAGDIVTSINGVELTQLDRGFQAIDELSNADQLTVTVLRGGQQQTIQLQLQ